jgi:hypothetical protein
MMSKVSVHCLDEECDSENIVMLNANWDFQRQQWIYNSRSSFLCRDCSVKSKEILWRAETDILGHALV